MSDPTNCCVINLPGAQGPPGVGTDGKDGFPAYTQLAAAFTMPAFGASDVASFVDAAWVALGEPIFVEGLGVLLVTNIAGTFITLLNLADGTHYVQNSAPGTVAPATSLVTPSGWQGVDGTSAPGFAPANAPYVLSTADGSLPLAQVLSIIATGILKVTTGTGALSKATDGADYLSPTTGLVPADIGVSVQAYSALLQAIRALGITADKIIYGTGVNTVALTALTAFSRTLLAASTQAAAQTILGIGAFAVVSKTVSYNATISDGLILCDATTGPITIGLPSAATAFGKELIVKKTDASANAITVDGNLSEKIDGALTQVISSQWTAVDMICDGNNWFIV